MDLSTPPPVVKFQQPSPEARSIRAFLLRRAGIPVDDLVPFLPSMTRCSFIYVPGSRHNNCSPDYSFTPCPPKPTIPSLPLRHPHKHGGIRCSHGDHAQHRGEGKRVTAQTLDTFSATLCIKPHPSSIPSSSQSLGAPLSPPEERTDIRWELRLRGWRVRIVIACILLIVCTNEHKQSQLLWVGERALVMTVPNQF